VLVEMGLLVALKALMGQTLFSARLHLLVAVAEVRQVALWLAEMADLEVERIKTFRTVELPV
jgi:hypothetical protein